MIPKSAECVKSGIFHVGSYRIVDEIYWILFLIKSIPRSGTSQLFTFQSSLFTFQSSLFTLHSSLFTFHFSLFTYILLHSRTTPRSLSCRAVTSSMGKSSIPHTLQTRQPTYMAMREASGCSPI